VAFLISHGPVIFSVEPAKLAQSPRPITVSFAVSNISNEFLLVLWLTPSSWSREKFRLLLFCVAAFRRVGYAPRPLARYLVMNADEMQGIAPTMALVASSTVEMVMMMRKFFLGSVPRKIARIIVMMMAANSRL
jgi:hypothetical protein